MVYGYARVSTLEQHLDSQLEALAGAGCQRIMQEKASGAKSDRPELQRLMGYVCKGDSIVITKLDRLARSTQHLLTLVERLTEKGVALRILNFGIDTGTITGKMMLTILGAVAEFERNLMLERQRDGIIKGQAAGHYKGRDPRAQRQSARILELLAGGATVDQAAEVCGISVASVYRIKRAARTVVV